MSSSCVSLSQLDKKSQRNLNVPKCSSSTLALCTAKTLHNLANFSWTLTFVHFWRTFHTLGQLRSTRQEKKKDATLLMWRKINFLSFARLTLPRANDWMILREWYFSQFIWSRGFWIAAHSGSDSAARRRESLLLTLLQHRILSILFHHLLVLYFLA